ncbi:MAG: hypothetical protein ACHQAR_05485 [Steroidobacterales bacterium]
MRDWLAGDWGIVFSHPRDFQYSGLESDRWLSILHDEFLKRGVRPLACCGAGLALDRSWVGDVVNDRRVVLLERGLRPGGDIVDLPLRALRDDIVGTTDRFALIVDDTMRRRGVLKYTQGRSSISPLDLLSSIDAMRRRADVRKAA